jgi:hypothetical protein
MLIAEDLTATIAGLRARVGEVEAEHAALLSHYREAAADLDTALTRAATAEAERDEARAALAAQRKRADSLAHAYLQEQGDNDKIRVEIAACRNQVESARALGVSLHKAADKGTKDERAAVVEWLRAESRVAGVSPDAKRLLAWASNQVERGGHRREETT